MTDQELVKIIIEGKKNSLNLFYKRFFLMIKGMVETKVELKEDAEEIIQDTLMTAWLSVSQYKGKSSLKTFVGAIARHEVADFYRKKKIKQILFSKLPFLERLASKALGPELALQEVEAKRKILRSFKRVSEGYAKILRLKYIEGLSMKDIAIKLNLSVKAVESRLTRARLAFRKVYETEEYKTEKKFFSQSGQDWFTPSN